MGLRPAKTSRHLSGQVWTRISRKKPRKSFVKGAPHPKVRQYIMGVDKPYELEVELVAEEPVRIRDNALEAARQAAGKYLEQNMQGRYFFQVVPYPHLVLREHAALGVAGSDRISKGMKLAFGKPKGRMAQLGVGAAIFRARIFVKDLPLLKTAFSRASLKIPGHKELEIRDISRDAVNLARKEVIFETKLAEAPKVETVAGGEAAKAEGAAAAAEAAPAKGAEKEKK